MTRVPTGEEIFSGIAKSQKQFTVVSEGHYVLTYSDFAVSLDVNRLRRRFDQVVGELTVTCNLPGTLADDDGVISSADFNFSSATERESHAKRLARSSRTDHGLWSLILEHLARRVLTAERQGESGVSLRDVAPASADQLITIDGLPLLRHHPSILFGDGSAGKSYLALYLAGKLAQQGLRVVYFDWELDAPDHRDRLASLFGASSMPDVKYVKCWKPAFHDIDRLRREGERWRADFGIFDSIVPACDGNPIDAEVVTRYMGVCRQLHVGSLHLAHITKGGGDQGKDNTQKPFGSVFWHNLARSTWYMERAQDSGADDNMIRVGLYQRKANLGRLSKPIGFQMEFSDLETHVTRFNLGDDVSLSRRLTVPQRMQIALRGGAMTLEQMAEEIEADQDTILRNVRRDKSRFVRVLAPDGITRIGLVENRIA